MWNEIAPLAAREGTLTDSTALALRDVCEAVILKRRLLRMMRDEDFIVPSVSGPKANPLLTQFRGLMQRVEVGLARFKLAPMGRPVEAPTAPRADASGVDRFAEFDAPATPGRTTH